MTTNLKCDLETRPRAIHEGKIVYRWSTIRNLGDPLKAKLLAQSSYNSQFAEYRTLFANAFCDQFPTWVVVKQKDLTIAMP